MRSHYRSAGAALGLLLLFGLAAAAASAEEETIAYLGETESFWQVFVMRADGSGSRKVTRSRGDKTRASWYPDGRALLVSSLEGRLTKVDLGTGTEEVLRLPARGTYDGALSPDGAWIAFSMSPAQARDNNEVFLVGSSGEGLRKLTRRVGLQSEPAWSADGRWIYFHASVGGSGQQDIVRIAPDGSGLEQLTAGQGFHFEVTVAPDGGLAFSSNRSGNYEIYVQEPGASEAVALTNHPASDGAPAFSPDGTMLVFESSRGGRHGLWRVPRSGGEPVAVPTERAARRPAWYTPPPMPGSER